MLCVSKSDKLQAIVSSPKKKKKVAVCLNVKSFIENLVAFCSPPLSAYKTSPYIVTKSSSHKNKVLSILPSFIV